MFDYLSTLFSEPIAFFDQAIFRTLAVLIGLCCHEWGHAYVAYRCGDDTAKRAGRLTLNPLRHLDPVGTILMFFAGFGYAKPCRSTRITSGATATGTIFWCPSRASRST